METVMPYQAVLSYQSKNDHASADYRTECLKVTLDYLERFFPESNRDHQFQIRYWNYGHHIYRLLLLRNCDRIAGSVFGRPLQLYAETPRRTPLKMEQERYAQADESLWEKPDGQMSVKDALNITGLKDMPAPEVPAKLRDAALAEHADDDLKAGKIKKAYDLLISEAR